MNGTRYSLLENVLYHGKRYFRSNEKHLSPYPLHAEINGFSFKSNYNKQTTLEFTHFTRIYAPRREI